MATQSRFRITAAALVIGALIAAFIVFNHPESNANTQSTDDAYIHADLTIVVPQVAGLITELNVADNQPIQAGQTLLRIDEHDLLIALDMAKAHVASAQASIASVNAQLNRQDSTIAQAQAAMSASQASLKLAQNNRQRFSNLARDGSGTLQAKQQAETEWQVQSAAYKRDQAGLHAAEQQSAVLKAEQEKAQAALLAAQAEQANAELKLSYAQISAPVAGIVTQRRARLGGYVHVGEPLLTLVPLDALYVEANFRETQLARVQIGQPVSLKVDALPGVELKGHVASLGPASGAVFSPLAARNATGNFTKIVQRLPVRIELDAGQDAVQKLRVGMSVRPSIDVSA
ncbi:HlyD family secretion protein [Alcaligenes faecalis]|uniref:HlyD family secretion protein n=1 Tax=Alcaligenes faecalis TaxID=511 RepID=A0AAE9KPL0_ALCFA|nr:HlyD family secretion protein [Alcaligenes faecalis]UPL22429.1 HlyD family secretion protein [Alcaligenes faecalis]